VGSQTDTGDKPKVTPFLKVYITLLALQAQLKSVKCLIRQSPGAFDEGESRRALVLPCLPETIRTIQKENRYE
jgi:hypothetical protein